MTPSIDTPTDELADPIRGQHPPERLAWIDRLRWANIALLLGLIVLSLSWELWLAPLKGGTGALAIKALPLALGISGLLKHRMYTNRWLSLLVWLYFTEGVVRATSDQGLSQQLAVIELILSVGLFVCCAVYVKLRLRVLPPKPKKGSPQALAAQAAKDTAA
jgi:uncharacterized membrane protein